MFFNASDFCLDMSISSSPSLILLGKTCIEYNKPIQSTEYELKTKDARQLRRPKQKTSSIATVVI